MKYLPDFFKIPFVGDAASGQSVRVLAVIIDFIGVNRPRWPVDELSKHQAIVHIGRNDPRPADLLIAAIGADMGFITIVTLVGLARVTASGSGAFPSRAT